MMKQGIVAISFVLKRSCIMYHIHWESKNKRQFLCSESQVPFWQVKPQHFQLLLTGFFFFAHSCGVPASLGSACLSQTHTNTHKHIYIYTHVPTQKLCLPMSNVFTQMQNLAAAQMNSLPILLTVCVQDTCLGCCRQLFQEGAWFVTRAQK